MLESRPEDALVKLVRTVEIADTARTAHPAFTRSDIYDAAFMNPEISYTLIL